MESTKTTLVTNGNQNSDIILWESSKYVAATKLSKQNEGSIRARFLKQFIRSNRSISQERHLTEAEYMNMAESSEVLNTTPGSSNNTRKLAVCQKSESEGYFVYKTIKSYKQINVLKDMSIL